MGPIKKLKNKRGTTLIEVLLVVALMTTLLGIAAPNLLAQTERLKRTALNDSARAVAVAVQSKLYGMKNAGTGTSSSYHFLGSTAATKKTFVADETTGEQKEVLFVSNFACEEGEDAAKKAALGKQYLLSGAITDLELLEKGKIVVGYDSESANVLYVFYGESEYEAARLFTHAGDLLSPQASETYLEQKKIGVYLGEGVPAPERNIGLPNFTISWKYDDELFLELEMRGVPDPSLYGKNLGLKIYANIPSLDGGKKYDEVLIYAEGFFGGTYKTEKAGNIEPDRGSLTIDKIERNGGKLRFAIDSMVTDKAGYGMAQPYLRHQTDSQIISAAENLLYPRETIKNWFNRSVNPYLTFWEKEEEIQKGNSILDRLTDGAGATEFVGVDRAMSLRVELHVLSDKMHEAKGTAGCYLYDFDDENFIPFGIVSEYISPYFFALAEDSQKVVLASVRDLNNLNYVFETNNSINRAELGHDITSQQLYDKLVDVRYALLAKRPDLGGVWGYAANWDTCSIVQIYIRNKENFTFSGKNPWERGAATTGSST